MSPTLCADVAGYTVATVKQTSFCGEIIVPGGETVPGVEASEQELTLADLTCISRWSVRSDRRLDKPKEWNGEASGFDDFVFKFANWLSLLPGDTERLLEESVYMGRPIVCATLGNSLTSLGWCDSFQMHQTPS